MYEKLLTKIILNLILLEYLFHANAQPSTRSLSGVCNFQDLETNNLSIKENLSDDTLDNLVSKKNRDKFGHPATPDNSTILTYFSEEFQIFLFYNSECTKQYLDKTGSNNFLHLFYINCTQNFNFFKLAIQTKKSSRNARLRPS